MWKAFLLFLLSGCAVTLGKGNNAAGLGTNHGQRSVDEPQATAASAAPVLQDGAFPASFRVGGVDVGVPLSLADVRMMFARALRPEEGVVEIVSVEAEKPVLTWASSPPATRKPALLPPPMCWVNPGGTAFHRRGNCEFVLDAARTLPCDEALALALEKRPCKTCGGAP